MLTFQLATFLLPHLRVFTFPLSLPLSFAIPPPTSSSVLACKFHLQLADGPQGATCSSKLHTDTDLPQCTNIGHRCGALAFKAKYELEQTQVLAMLHFLRLGSIQGRLLELALVLGSVLGQQIH